MLDTIAAKLSTWLRRHHLIAHVVITVLIVTPGYVRIQSIVQDIIDARADGRIAACQVDRNFGMAHNALVHSVETMVTTVFHLTTANQSATVKAQVEQLIARLNGPLELNVVPVRTCDPKSIVAFYGHKGTK